MSESLQQGIAAYKAGLMEQASSLLRKAAEEEPSNPEVWYYVSFTLDDLDRKRKALRYALQLNPNYAEAAEELRRLSQSVPYAASATISPPTIPPVPPMPGYTMQPPTGMPGAYPGTAAYPDRQLGPQGYGASLWGPFAGYGTRRRHIGWLMDNKAERVEELIGKTRTRLADRQIPFVNITEEQLTNKGIAVETRPYFLIRRDLVTIGLNISQFGKDLFVSIASFLKPPISSFRVIALVIAVIYWIFYLFLPLIINSALTNAVNNMMGSLGSIYGSSGYGSSGNGLGGLMFLVCFLGPIGFVDGIALGIFLIYSFYKWLKEKDFWAALRTTPNEFNEDDLMALEKAAEQTVRQSIDEIGLDANDLIPVTAEQDKRLI
ncbi:MAG TPA: hypothetical protein VN376_04125 [Longilinea sp.]|nr:hypothetical protein [Longilinea sp.]